MKTRKVITTKLKSKREIHNDVLKGALNFRPLTSHRTYKGTRPPDITVLPQGTAPIQTVTLTPAAQADPFWASSPFKHGTGRVMKRYPERGNAMVEMNTPISDGMPTLSQVFFIPLAHLAETK